MKYFVSVIFVAQIVFCVGQYYNSKYDNLDVNMVLSNRRILMNYIKCMLDEGPCTPEGRLLRTYIPEAMVTKCAKCTEAQKNIVRKGSRFVIKNHPDKWARISKKFDPEGRHTSEFMAFLNS